MKKQLLYLSFGLLVAGAFTFSGCSKDDTTAPILTLTGATSLTYSLPNSAGGGGTFTDPGYAASDDKDGNITSKVTVSGTVDLNRKGTYTLTYTVSDAAGNSASATRTVVVVNDADVFGGVYNNCIDTCAISPLSHFTATVTVSDSVNDLVAIGNFGSFDSTGTIKVWATFSGTSASSPITIANGQSLGSPAFISHIYTIDTYVLTGTAPTSFQVHYQWDDSVSQDVCTSIYTR